MNTRVRYLLTSGTYRDRMSSIVKGGGQSDVVSLPPEVVFPCYSVNIYDVAWRGQRTNIWGRISGSRLATSTWGRSGRYSRMLLRFRVYNHAGSSACPQMEGQIHPRRVGLVVVGNGLRYPGHVRPNHSSVRGTTGGAIYRPGLTPIQRRDSNADGTE